MQQQFSPRPNSFKNTFCVFQEVSPDSIAGLSAQYHSKSGSTYFYTSEGMYRLSHHWGRLANSKWRLEPLQELENNYQSKSKIKLGYATWNSFYPDNANEDLYYLEVNYTTNTVNYQHRNNPKYNGIAILRKSIDTTKKIKQIRNLFELTSWAKYYDYDDIDSLRKQIIEQLITTNKPLDEIKKQYMGRNNERNIKIHNDKLHKEQDKVKAAKALRKERLKQIVKQFNENQT